MRKLFLLFAVLFVGNLAMSQAQKQLNFGVGVNNGGLPVYASYDIPVHNDIAVAPFVQFNLDGFDYFAFGARGDYYFDRIMKLPESFDFYAGANLGYWMWFNNNNSTSPIYGGLEVGGRWFWSEKWGMNLEFSGGIGYGVRFGLTYKM